MPPFNHKTALHFKFEKKSPVIFFQTDNRPTVGTNVTGNTFVHKTIGVRTWMPKLSFGNVIDYISIYMLSICLYHCLYTFQNKSIWTLIWPD